MQRMMEIITLNPDPIIGRLIELGFVIEEVIDWLGSDGSTIMASMLTGLEEEEDFFSGIGAAGRTLDVRFYIYRSEALRIAGWRGLQF